MSSTQMVNERTAQPHATAGVDLRLEVVVPRIRPISGDVVSDAVLPDHDLPDHRGTRVMLRRRRVLAVSGRLGAQAAERSRHDPTTLRSLSGNLLHHIWQLFTTSEVR